MIFNLFKKKQTKTDISILYEGPSGISKVIARETSKILREQGIDHNCRNLHDFSLNELTKLKYMFLVVNIHGEADFPLAARKLYDYLHDDNAPFLKQLNYSVCVLGDSSYTNICKTGIDIDKRLNDLGGRAIIKRVDCGNKYGENASDWIKQVIGYFKETPAPNSSETLELPSREETKFVARIKSKERINHPLSDKEVFHMELSVWDKSFCYKPGDTISILPKNPEHFVREVLKIIIHRNVKKTINLDKYQVIFNQLLHNYEITRLHPQTVEKYNQLVQNDDLKRILENEYELERFLKGSNILTLLVWYPYKISIDQLLKILPKLKPMHYPVASSIKKHPHEVHLTVRTTGYSNHKGVCSHFLNHFLKINDHLEIELFSNNYFHFNTKTPNPIIMIAAGTGIAPFKGFLEELDADVVKKKTWLIFGERNPKYDRIYQNELSIYSKKGVLDKLDMAFSKGESKCYVQEILRGSITEVLDWIKKGAEIYICGSSAMGRGVKKVFEEILVDEPQELNQLINEDRYKEVYF